MSRLYIGIILTILFVFCKCLPAACQTLAEATKEQAKIASKLTIDRDKYSIGDVINLSIETTSPEDITIQEPDPGEFLKDFEIRNIKKPFIQKGEGQNKTIFQYEITTFTTGKKTIGPVTINYKTSSGETHQIKSNTLTCPVESVLPKNGKNLQIKDIKPPEEVKYPPYYYIIGALTTIAFIVVIYLLIRYILGKIKNKRTQEKEILKTPEEIADERLRALLSSSLLKEGKIKEYYVELSEIVRQYIEGRYKIDAFDRTTFELYQELKNTKIAQEVVGDIKELLTSSDLVKFAKFIPEPEKIHRNYEETKKIIELLKPKGDITEEKSTVK